MKTLSIAISVASFAFAAVSSNAFAQRTYDPRIDVPGIVNPDRDYDRGGRHGDWQLRLRADIDQLNADVQRTRARIGDSRDREVRARFHDITRATDRLNGAYRRGYIRGPEARNRIDAIRADLERLNRALEGRYERRGWR